MKKLLFARNNILVEETPQVPLNFGEIQAKKDLESFRDNLIKTFNDDCEKYEEFLDDLIDIDAKIQSGDLSDFKEL